MTSFIRHINRAAHSMQGEKSGALSMARSRALIMLLCFFGLYAVVAMRVFDLTYVRPLFSSDQPVFSAKIETPKPDIMRGNIYDRNQMLLAGNIDVPSLYADPFFIEDKKATAKALARIFKDKSAQDYLSEIDTKRRFVLIKEDLTAEEQKAVLDAGQPGLMFKEETKRIYPQGTSAAHMLGFTGRDGGGLEGIERAFNEKLAAGESVVTTLDMRLQHVMHKALIEKVEAFTAKSASGLIMDIHSGDILAAASVPDYDPNVFGQSKASERFNGLMQGVHEMGSTFKIFSTAALLETLHPRLSKTYDATEPLVRGRFKINDYHGEERELTIPEIFSHSSNIGSALMGEEIGTQALRNFYRDLGLMERVSVNDIQTAQPLLPSTWRDINTLTASYGHGMAVTPLHVVQAVGTIANGGLLVRPNILLNEDDDQNVNRVRVITEENSEKMRQLMRLVVRDGTGSKAEVEGYGVGGKTGTAEKIGANGRYDKKKLLSSFVGVFPVDDPEYLVFVMVDEPVGNKQSWGYATAGWTAAPAVAEIITKMTRILGMPATYTRGRDMAFVGEVEKLVRKPEKEEREKVASY